MKVYDESRTSITSVKHNSTFIFVHIFKETPTKSIVNTEKDIADTSV